MTTKNPHASAGPAGADPRRRRVDTAAAGCRRAFATGRRGPWNPIPGVVLLLLVAETIRLATELKDVSMIGQAVNEGSGEALVAEDLGPVGKGEIGGDDHCYLFMEGRAELKQELGTGRREGNKPQFVQDDQAMFEGGSKEF